MSGGKKSRDGDSRLPCYVFCIGMLTYVAGSGNPLYVADFYKYCSSINPNEQCRCLVFVTLKISSVAYFHEPVVEVDRCEKQIHIFQK